MGEVRVAPADLAVAPPEYYEDEVGSLHEPSPPPSPRRGTPDSAPAAASEPDTADSPATRGGPDAPGDGGAPATGGTPPAAGAPAADALAADAVCAPVALPG